VILTKDDQFFENPLGILRDPEILTSTIVFAFATLTQKGNRFIGTYYIVEADVYLRSDFFTLAKLTYQRLGAGAFRLALGYQPTVWSHDHLSNKPHHVSNPAFTNKTSMVWTGVSHVRDDFYYQDKLGINFTPNFLSTPMLMPFENEVIDLGDYDLPKVDEQGNVDMSKTPILFLTNLLGLDKSNNRMIIRIYRVTDDTPPKNIRIVTLRGNTMRYPVPVTGFSRKFYASIFLNNVRLGRIGDLNKLLKAVNNHGILRTIDGIDFEKALRIKVKVTGFLGEGGKKKNLSRLFWLVNTEEEL
jgi:hypothetical protein